jgi:hypothetical protein
LPADELVRLAVGVLARLLPGLPPPAPPPDLTRWPVPWRRRFRLHGSPGTVAAVRKALFAQGLVETDWRPVHLVLARPLEVMMAEHWAATTVAGGQLRWAALWRRAEAIDALPARLDVVRTSERLAAGTGSREPVHLVIARQTDDLARHVGEILGTRSLDLTAATNPAQIDLVRRLNRLSALTQGAGQVRRLAATLAAVLDDAGVRPPALTVPRNAAAWASRTAAASVERIPPDAGGDERGSGYSVHGEPGVLAPTAASGSGTVDPRDTLEVALDGCLLAWGRQERTT